MFTYVVGGGSAGCVLASRLSQNFTVLLLEAGGTPVPTTYVPYLNYNKDFLRNREINYIINSEKEKYFSLQTGGVRIIFFKNF